MKKVVIMITSIKDSLGLNKDSDLNVRFRRFAKRRCLYFKYRGFLNAESIKMAIAKSKEFPMPNFDKKRVLVFDCSGITDYDVEARSLLREMLIKSEGKVETVWIISDSITILGLTEILSFFSRIEIKAVRNVDQLENKLYRNSA